MSVERLERVKKTVDQILSRVPAVRGRGEQATKQSLLLPMLDALGYDIWSPEEVCPEYDADFAVKKLGQKEKVDLAVLINRVPRIFFEVNSVETALEGHQGQLARYFNAVQSVSLAVLTNGIDYWFYTDTGDLNVMDPVPFFTAKLDAIDPGFEVLARFHKSVFSPEAIRDYATELNYTARLTEFLRHELDLGERDPSENFVRWILAGEKMYPNRVTSGVVERFCPIVKNALQIVLRDIVRRSVAALDKEVTAPSRPEPSIEAVEAAVEAALEPGAPAADFDVQEFARDRIQTTERELECFAVVKEQFETSALAAADIFDATARKEVPIRIAYKDTTGYFCIYFNKPSWWVMRSAIDARVPWVGFNLSPEIGSNLIPPGFSRLDPHPFAEFRVGVSGPSDLHALHRLVFAAFQKTVEDRISAREGDEAALSAKSGA